MVGFGDRNALGGGLVPNLRAHIELGFIPRRSPIITLGRGTPRHQRHQDQAHPNPHEIIVPWASCTIHNGESLATHVLASGTPSPGSIREHKKGSWPTRCAAHPERFPSVKRELNPDFRGVASNYLK